MRLVSISIEGFRGFPKPIQFDLSADVIVLHGPNGSGKTSLLDAILWAITGQVTRVENTGSAISLYATEGIARVQLVLSDGDKIVEIVRVAESGSSDTGLKLSIDAEEFSSEFAESELLRILLPENTEITSFNSLADVITRAIYLQQDLVREFVESDSDDARFKLLSNVTGAGVIPELQEFLEKSRKHWATTTSKLEKNELKIEQEKFDDIQRRLEGLSTSKAIGTSRLEEIESYFDKIRNLPSLRNLVAHENLSAGNLDQVLRNISMTKANLDRSRHSISNLQERIFARNKMDSARASALVPMQEALVKSSMELERKKMN